MDRNTLQYVSCTMHGLHYCLHLLSAFGLHYCLHLLSADNLQTMQTIKQTMQSAMAFIIVFIIGLSALLSALSAEQTKPSLLAIPWCKNEGHPSTAFIIVCIYCLHFVRIWFACWHLCLAQTRQHAKTFATVQRRVQTYIGLFCGNIGLFCGNIGLFCGDIGLLCGDRTRAKTLAQTCTCLKTV